MSTQFGDGRRSVLAAVKLAFVAQATKALNKFVERDVEGRELVSGLSFGAHNVTRFANR
jgi:hypothetical protein